MICLCYKSTIHCFYVNDNVIMQCVYMVVYEEALIVHKAKADNTTGVSWIPWCYKTYITCGTRKIQRTTDMTVLLPTAAYPKHGKLLIFSDNLEQQKDK